MIYIMRHGQDDESYVGGWSNVSLIPEGQEEVKVSALWIKETLDIKQIMCSDVARARQTAQIVSEILGLPIILNPNLREQNKGLLNGMPRDEANNRYPELMGDEVTVLTVYPEGESLRDLYERVKAYLEELMSLPDDTLLITHRGVINMVYFILNNVELNMDKKQFGVETASVHEIDKVNRKIKKVR